MLLSLRVGPLRGLVLFFFNWLLGWRSSSFRTLPGGTCRKLPSVHLLYQGRQVPDPFFPFDLLKFAQTRQWGHPSPSTAWLSNILGLRKNWHGHVVKVNYLAKLLLGSSFLWPSPSALALLSTHAGRGPLCRSLPSPDQPLWVPGPCVHPISYRLQQPYYSERSGSGELANIANGRSFIPSERYLAGLLTSCVW